MLNYLYKGLPYDCYFCRSDIFGFSNDIKGAIKGDIKDMLGGVNDVLTTNLQEYLYLAYLYCVYRFIQVVVMTISDQLYYK